MAKAKKKLSDKYHNTLLTKENILEILQASVDALPQIEARNKIIHERIIAVIKEKPDYKYSDDGQYETREGLLKLLPDLDEQTITSALIDMNDLKIIDSNDTLHFPSHYFK